MYLGVDGGGTKTAFCVLDQDRRVAGMVETGTTYFLSVGLEEVERRLVDGVARACRAAGISPADLDYAFFGLPAHGEVSSVVERLDALPRSALGHGRYRCGNDMICGWAGSLGGADGINVIAGTGSMTYGENGGRGARCGGWGEIFGDEGSAYWIGAQALAAFSRMSDGRRPPTHLHARLKARLEIATDLDLVDVVLNRWAGDRARIAELAQDVDAAEADGDTAAGAILDAAADELVLLVHATRAALGFADEATVPVSHTGSVFRSARVHGRFSDTLSRGAFELRRPLYEPSIGAALYAARLAGQSVEPRTD